MPRGRQPIKDESKRKIIFTIRLRRDYVEQLNIIAERNNISLGKLIERFITSDMKLEDFK